MAIFHYHYYYQNFCWEPQVLWGVWTRPVIISRAAHMYLVRGSSQPQFMGNLDAQSNVVNGWVKRISYL